MPRTGRSLQGGYCYHLVNRGNERGEVFHESHDYAGFLSLMAEAHCHQAMRLLAYCLMPNHFHFVVWPLDDGDVSHWMHWLATTHVRRYRRHYGGSGHVWQGRFSAFPIQCDNHLLTVIRYVERNPVRANLVDSAADWPWSSIGSPPTQLWTPALHLGPVRRGADWLEHVNQPLTAAELAAVRHAAARGKPFGSTDWIAATAKLLRLEFTLRPRGRPSRKRKHSS